MTKQAYQLAYDTARVRTYPAVDAFEAQMGHALDRPRLEAAARVLACPLKANPPHWQHGRVLYAAARRRLESLPSSDEGITLLDIGTAKGFSALCLRWALEDDRRHGTVHSVDVIDPRARVSRNTVAELDGVLTLSETLEPWPEAADIRFEANTGIGWLQAHPGRVHVAFVDGKHSGDVVRQEGKLLAQRQVAGDVVVFDDVQIPAVSVAVVSLQEWYRMEFLSAEPREYAIGWRR